MIFTTFRHERLIASGRSVRGPFSVTITSCTFALNMDTRKEEGLEDRAIVKIAAHLPDLIVYGDFSPERPSMDYFDGVLMFVDISGFTEMTEKFSTAMYMDRGAEQLVELLNHYMSAIVEKVLIFGGDILKFAGDALLALWKVERRQLKNFITVVIKCSLEIHGLFEAQELEEGLDVRVKIGLAAGHITMLVFGDETRDYFLVIGQAVDDVRLAQNMAQMNDVILSPNCWQLCDRSMVEIERIPDQRAVKVNFLKPPPTFNFDEFFTNCMTFMEYYPSGEHKNILRLACMLESDPDLELSLQKYMMENILKQIDDKQLRGYLSELRPVTIVFVNLVFKDQAKAEVIGSAIQDASVHINSVLRALRGQINKVFMFDKGCSFLCVFGFPGEKAPNEVSHALESAVDIFDFCSQVHKIHTVSIGVASGTVFCGIVGHSVRHEYTVIGQKVNIAARMMTYYPGVVTCDSVTYNGSNLPPYFFKELPKKVMKGVADAGPVYQCLGLHEKVMFGMAYLICNRNEGYPLLGRDKEIKYFMYTMKEFLGSNCSRVLMYEGLSGYGKSQILMEAECLAQRENHRTIAIALTKISFQQNFYTIQILMAIVLGLDVCKHYKERQTNIQNRVKTLLEEKFYCLLNDIFHVQFPISREASKMTTLKKQKQLEALFLKILEQKAKEERIIFIIDEAQFVDLASWAFMEKLIRTVPICIVMSLCPFPRLPCAAAGAIIKNRNTTYVAIGALRPEDIRNKVCLDLNVEGIPKELDSYLVEGSCGIPFYCEELLRNLDHHRVLVFHPLECEEKTNVTWNNLFKSLSKPTEKLKMLECHGEEEEEEEEEEEPREVCHLAGGVRLKNLSPPASLKDKEETNLSKTGIVKKRDIFSENLSSDEISERILNFFDSVIMKMRTLEEDIIPLEACQCEEILEVVIMPLAHHFLALGENNKALYYFLEIASAYLIMDDNYMAYTYLNEGERLLKTLKDKKSWSQTFELATFYCLKGQVCFNMGQMVLAKKTLRKALKLLNRVFPSNLVSLCLQTHVEKKRHFRYMNQEAQEGPSPGRKRLAQLHQQTACFSLLWKIYSLNYFFHYKYYAQLAALMQVNTALETQDAFQITKAYLELSLHHQLAGDQGVWFKYEIMAMEHIFSLPLKGEGIEIVAYAATMLGHTKLMMGHLELATDLGSRAQKLWALLRNPKQQFESLCWLSRCLLLKNRHKHLIQVLECLWDLSVVEGHIFGKAFFYFVCMDVMLYSGFVYRTFEECLDFVCQNEDNALLQFHSGLLLGLYSCIAVWYARLQEWSDFIRFSSKAKTLVLRRTPTPLYLIGMCRYLEGQVLHLQKQIAELSENAQDSGVEIFKNLESLATQNTTGVVFYPRLYHLMAYICVLMGDGQNCSLFLDMALSLCEAQGNVLEKCWLEMSKEWWYSNSRLTEDRWRRIVHSLPSWEKIVANKVHAQDIQKYKFLMRVNILDNPF
ncbi:adenylate cyclase type 10 isoform X3 [Rousettus aegyptiacus]|uniref:adenylate cyclase type 10 isoform X3 n=1 Tax=Rousettus aegyptiacus TaxID=9407 RepID=UPI0007869BD0|nr:adenylate cyclase type 10 isoform X3 [Rousettus aegyptiacus]